MLRLFTTLKLSLLLICSAFILPVAVQAQDPLQWIPGQMVSDGDASSGPADIAVAADGSRASAVWAEDQKVRARSAAPSGSGTNFTWESGSTFLSSTGTHGVASDPKVALSGDGKKGIVVWSGDTSGTMTIFCSVGGETAGQLTWGAATAVSTPAAGTINQARVALSENGSTAVIIWRDAAATRIYARPATISGTTPTLGTIKDLSGGGGSSVLEPRIAISRDGATVVAAWLTGSLGITSVRAAVGRISGGAVVWDDDETISNPMIIESASADEFNAAGNLDLVISGDGTSAIAVWNDEFRVQTNSALITSSSATWDSSPAKISPENGKANNPKVAISHDGSTALAIWNWHDLSSDHVIQVIPRVASGGPPAWQTKTDLYQTGVTVESEDYITPWVALSSDGLKATAVWTGFRTEKRVLESAAGAVSGGTTLWSEVSVISNTDDSVSGVTKLSASQNLSVNFVTWPVMNDITEKQSIWSSHTVTTQPSPTPTSTPLTTATPTATTTPDLTPIPTPAPPAPTPSVILSVIKKGIGDSPLNSPKVRSFTVSADNSVGVKICFPFRPLPPTANMYGIIERTHPKPARKVADKRIRINKRCISAKLGKFGTYEAFSRQDRFRKPSVTSKKIRFTVGPGGDT